MNLMDRFLRLVVEASKPRPTYLLVTLAQYNRLVELLSKAGGEGE